VRQEVAGHSSVVLAQCKAVALHRCRLAKFLASNALAVKVLADEGKSEAGAYCLVRSRDGREGSTTVPVFVRFSHLVQWHDASPQILLQERVLSRLKSLISRVIWILHFLQSCLEI
jgi:hypothetical protein